ncbi:MAG: hypothetical protein M3O32_16530, partial [Actinomycetota bacterium]|nr:hypothetical protein [Actinomycetota bacterium]
AQRFDLASQDAPLRLRHLCEGADCVVHLSWNFGPTRDLDYLFRAGVGGTTALMTAAHEARVSHFVHLRASWRLHLQPVDPGWFDLAMAMPLLNTDQARHELDWSPRWSSLGEELRRDRAPAALAAHRTP